MPIYQKLEPHSFRVLEILAGKLGDPVNGRLKRVTFRSHIQYEALSYCWGTSIKNKSIKIDGKNFGITENLLEALQALRHPDKARPLWVDAICINQADMKEREQEVMKMVRIYAKAANVIIWIGESDYITQKAMEVIDEMAKHRKRDAASDDSVRFLASNYNKLPGSDWRLRGILHIIERKWFGRGWIVQEASVSRDAQVRCGAQSVSLIDLYRAYRYLVYIGGAFLNQECSDNIHGISMSQMAYQKKLDRPLHSLLLRHRRAQTTLQVDKVYALAGLASDWAELNVKIDYAKPWREVYRDVAIAVLKHSGTLDILSGPRPPTHDPRSQDLPSWVPNWTFRDQMKSLLGHEMSVSHMYPNCAGGSDRPSIRFSETLHHLILSGATIGTITEVGQTMPPFNVASRSRPVSEVILRNKYGLIQQILASWERVARFHRRGMIYPTGEQTYDVYWQTLLCGYSFETYEKRRMLFVAWDRTLYLHRFNKALFGFPVMQLIMAALINGIVLVVYQILASGRYSVLWPDQTLAAATSLIAIMELVRRVFASSKEPFKYLILGVCLLIGRSRSRQVNLVYLIYSIYLLSDGSFETLSVTKQLSKMAVCHLLVEVTGSFLARRWTDPGIFFLMIPCTSRAIARASSGYIGMVPGSAKPGDVLVVVQGGKLPLLLRAKGENWVIIGDSYVHGVMNGELLGSECSEFIIE